MDRDQLHKIFTFMESNGSHFTSRLASTWFHADKNNKAIIEKGFQHVIDHYLDLMNSPINRSIQNV